MKLAIAITVFNRPDYFRRCAEHIARLPEVRAGTPVYVLGDPSPGNKLDECLPCIPSDWHWIVHPHPVGVPYYKQTALRVMFGLGYDAVFCVEDDVLVGQFGLSLALSILRWSTQHYSGIGSVSLSLRDIHSKDRRALCDCAINQCAQIYLKKTFDLSLPYLDEYEHILDQVWPASPDEKHLVRYHWPHTAIKAWVAKKCRDMPRPSKDSFPAQLDYQKWHTEIEHSGTDILLDLALRCLGLSRPSTCVSRVLYIGEVGANSNPDTYREQGYLQDSLVECSDDATMDDFFALPGLDYA